MFAFKYLFKGPYSIVTSANNRQLLKLMAKYGDVPRYHQKNISFLNYTFVVPDCMSFLFQFQEIFADEFYKFSTKELKPVILDCGANIGMSCAYFSALYPAAQITAYEADAKIADILKENIRTNSIPNVSIINKAVWIDDKGIEFASEGSDGASIFGAGEKVNVESIRLKDALLKLPRVDMLKMDIEGAETAVLKDCAEALSAVENMFIEYHSFPGQKQELHEILHILSENNFRYYISSAQDRKSPFINHLYRGNTVMDLQLNIFAYKA
ncbi:MAG: FkbM family methyltransferase [Cytophagales bacterium]|nr:FkbM family methyltransferase [Cytophaga sp.]